MSHNINVMAQGIKSIKTGPPDKNLCSNVTGIYAKYELFSHLQVYDSCLLLFYVFWPVLCVVSVIIHFFKGECQVFSEYFHIWPDLESHNC